jgi:cytochrome c oxidase subunit 4
MTVVEKKNETKRPPYIRVFIALSILTVIEVILSQLPILKAPVLIPISLLKASLVALFYMHLRYDRRVFAVLFGFGIVLGVGFLIALVVLLNSNLGGVKIQ